MLYLSNIIAIIYMVSGISIKYTIDRLKLI